MREPQHRRQVWQAPSERQPQSSQHDWADCSDFEQLTPGWRTACMHLWLVLLPKLALPPGLSSAQHIAAEWGQDVGHASLSIHPMEIVLAGLALPWHSRLCMGALSCIKLLRDIYQGRRMRSLPVLRHAFTDKPLMGRAQQIGASAEELRPSQHISVTTVCHHTSIFLSHLSAAGRCDRFRRF